MTTEIGRDDARPARTGPDLPPTPAAPSRDRVLRGGEDADLVAYALAGVGYLPWDSVLHVALQPTSDGALRTGTVARCDLAALDEPGFVADLVDSLAVAGAHGAAVVVVGRPPGRAQPFDTARRRRDVRAGAAALPGGPRRVRRPILVEGDRYGHVRCPAHCCPPSGRPFAEVRSSRLAVAEALDGRALVRSRTDLGVTPCADPARRAAARAAADAAGGAEPGGRRTLCAAWDAALAGCASGEGPGGPVDPTPAVLGELAAALADTSVRDAILGALLTGVATSAPLLDPEALTRHLVAARTPPVDRCRTADRLLGAVAAHAPEPIRVHALASLGYLRWWTGQGVAADVVTRQALELDPGHSLAGLVRQALVAHVPPPWFASAAGGSTAPDGARGRWAQRR